MGKIIERLFAAAKGQTPDRRISARAPTTEWVTVKTVSGEIIRAQLNDVSTHGCSVSTKADWLRNGRIVTLTLDTEESLQAIIRWSSDDTTGFEFLRPVTADRPQWLALTDSPWSA